MVEMRIFGQIASPSQIISLTCQRYCPFPELLFHSIPRNLIQHHGHRLLLGIVEICEDRPCQSTTCSRMPSVPDGGSFPAHPLVYVGFRQLQDNFPKPDLVSIQTPAVFGDKPLLDRQVSD